MSFAVTLREMEARDVRLISQSPADWQAGYIAGMSDEAPAYPPEISDHLAFWAGFNAGRAARRRAAVLSSASDE